MDDLNRRQILELLGASLGSAALPSLATGADRQPAESPAFALPPLPSRPYTKPVRPVTAVIVGHGSRGSLYGSFALRMPDEWRIAGVAEPIPYRRERCVADHAIAAENAFTTWEHVFERPRFADVAVITTQDRMHFGPAMAALDLGYDLLLEKPIAPSWEECRAIYRKAREKGAIVAVCHVLRYAPYFVELREIVASGTIGEVVSIQHLEPVQHLHMSHSYVRGPWRRKDEATPIILAKSCHDLDLLCWWTGRRCERVSAFGSLAKFTAANAPAGAPPYCLDGCPAETTCPYHAGNVYVHRKQWGTYHIVSPDRSDAGILAELRRGQFGRCVYRCDNDVPDHMVTNLAFAGRLTAAFSLEACTSYGGRRTRVMGTLGDVVGDETTLAVSLFAGGRATWDVTKAGADLAGHGGGDQRLVRDLVQAVARRDPALLPSTLERSLESHLIGFMAEESRLAAGSPREVALAL